MKDFEGKVFRFMMHCNPNLSLEDCPTELLTYNFATLLELVSDVMEWEENETISLTSIPQK